ncbi:GSCFA domain-containing protein [Reichenbachiella versicolor]|uniref:GSCFA domain-containing protein n=1 Tax=Reichenbachiella versicolor TaxID=1821036 RepID=UPI000D6DEA94|nr:GSCFA domain-containing protein [Reichenbachiella versicolor]
MIPFRTELHIDPNPDKIEYNSKILSIGSQFSNLMMSQFCKYKFQVNSNPYGTIYNPISIFNLIKTSVYNSHINQSLVTANEGVWNHFDFHYQSRAHTQAELMSNLEERIADTHDYMMQTGFLFITMGSAYVFKRRKDGHIVANCHRASAQEFDKSLLTPSDIVDGFRSIYNSLNHVKNIILVVSPVMHSRDSLTLNEVSKSVLRLACHLIMAEFPYVKYFPAYEFLTSDLRDYRYYQNDLMHPSESAMEYILSKFVEAYMHDESKECIQEVESIIEALNAKPYNPQSEEYKNFIQEAILRIDRLSDKMNLSEWTNTLKEKLEA